MKRRTSRRMILLGACAGAALLACGDDEIDDITGGGGDAATSGSGGGSTSSSGGADAGGAGGAETCGVALVVKGSNYASDPHDLTIPIADFEAGLAKTYTTTGVGHTHTVTISEADFTALRNGETVKKYICYDNPSSTDHEFVISCADPNVMPTFEGEIGTIGNCPA
jgi:hypothetical protein